MITDQELQEIRDRTNAAKKGPWDWYDFDGQEYLGTPSDHCDWCKEVSYNSVIVHIMENGWGSSDPIPEKEFIKHSRTDIPKLLDEIDRLRDAIKEHHSQKADDRCIEDDDKLYSTINLPPCDRRVGSKEEMLENCKRFIENRCEEGGWKTYRELEEELELHRKDWDEVRRVYEHCFPDRKWGAAPRKHVAGAIFAKLTQEIEKKEE